MRDIVWGDHGFSLIWDIVVKIWIIRVFLFIPYTHISAYFICLA